MSHFGYVSLKKLCNSYEVPDHLSKQNADDWIEGYKYDDSEKS